ncbi:helix-turn-helix transcriptional regulator [Isoptericola hypogeus]|uniref:Helix-turn-helix transcriptional regulator n=1 Tax=Isoptericola hypogeus TaxID=300179 RepID=A0ABP4VFD1_9MICO
MDDNGTLASFLRAARGRVTPADIGLTTASFSVRRVPGLRRDEVAALAGVSVDYYTRMEQGRVARASDAVINALSSSLRLTETERVYLFTLLSASTGGRVQADKRSTRVRSSLRQMLDQMDNAAAFVLGVGMDVLAMNDLAKAFLHDFTKEKGLNRSLARWTFLNPAAREFYVDWELVAADVAAILRRDSSSHPNDRELNELIGELTVKSDEFRTWWPRHKVYECSFGRKKTMHPVVGRVDINYETFPVPGEPDQQLFVYTAATGSPSEDALRILSSWEKPDPAPSTTRAQGLRDGN